MASLKLNVSAGLAKQITDYVRDLGGAAAVPAGHSGTSTANGFVGTVSAGNRTGADAAGQRIMEAVERKFGAQIKQQSGQGAKALDSWEQNERIRRFGA